MVQQKPKGRGRLVAIAGKLRRHKRSAPDPDALQVEQPSARPGDFSDRWGSYGPPVESPPNW